MTHSEEGSKTHSEEGSKTHSDKGSKTHSEEGSKTHSEEGSKTHSEEGSKTHSEEGSKTHNVCLMWKCTYYAQGHSSLTWCEYTGDQAYTAHHVRTHIPCTVCTYVHIHIMYSFTYC